MKNLLFVSLLALALSGCAHLALEAPAASLAATSYEEADTVSREILQCLGRKIVALQSPGQDPLLIAVEGLRSAFVTAAYTPQELPIDASTALKSALAGIPGVVYADARDVEQRFPAGAPVALYIDGAILFQERMPKVEGSTFDVSGGGLGSLLGFRARRKDQASRAAISIDLNAVLGSRVVGGLLLPKVSALGLSAPMRVEFDRSAARENSVAASIADFAIGAEKVSYRVTSAEQALRVALAHQVARILGRYLAIPGYWRCYGGAEDPLVVTARREDFAKIYAQHGESAAVGYLQDLLAFNGVLLNRSAQLDKDTVAALSQFVSPAAVANPETGKSSLDLQDAYWALIQAAVDQPVEVRERGRAWVQSFEVTQKKKVKRKSRRRQKKQAGK